MKGWGGGEQEFVGRSYAESSAEKRRCLVRRCALLVGLCSKSSSLSLFVIAEVIHHV
jgi:hypothetical protein